MIATAAAPAYEMEQVQTVLFEIDYVYLPHRSVVYRMMVERQELAEWVSEHSRVEILSVRKHVRVTSLSITTVDLEQLLKEDEMTA